MDQQTAVFEKMTAIVDDVTAGSDPKEASTSLTTLGEELKELKIKLAEITSTKDADNAVGIKDRSDFLDATAALQMAQQKLFMSGNLTPEITQALKAHINSAPMTGEGAP